jgi:predicted ArsR family transcriptional regulator
MRNDFITALLARQGEIGSAIWTTLWLREHAEPGQEIAVGTIAKELNTTKRRVFSHLSKLERAGVIARESVEGRPSHYRILCGDDHE